DRALSLDPDSAYVHNVRADLLAALGRRNEATAEYKKALAIAPDLKESLDGLKALQRGKP
ncbi:MAG TPA: tetratricopeptide repeat protein, partial [Methyloceanibacter sp.]|nr:tetratricopeptide repeat protein [Methyloceanibacter sp.]